LAIGTSSEIIVINLWGVDSKEKILRTAAFVGNVALVGDSSSEVGALLLDNGELMMFIYVSPEQYRL
jgi:hypothetical protein